MKFLTHEQFQQEIMQYKARLFRLARCIVKNEHDAQDAVCEAIYKAFRGLDSLKHSQAFGSWIYRITVNESNRILRKRKNMVDLEEARNVAAREEPGWQLTDYIVKLPEDLRVSVYLFYYEDLPMTEIARIAGIPLNTVKSRLRRAKEQLKRMIPAEEVLQNGF